MNPEIELDIESIEILPEDIGLQLQRTVINV